jgi:hypothetical protein
MWGCVVNATPRPSGKNRYSVYRKPGKAGLNGSRKFRPHGVSNPGLQPVTSPYTGMANRRISSRDGAPDLYFKILPFGILIALINVPKSLGAGRNGRDLETGHRQHLPNPGHLFTNRLAAS